MFITGTFYHPSLVLMFLLRGLLLLLIETFFRLDGRLFLLVGIFMLGLSILSLIIDIQLVSKYVRG